MRLLSILAVAAVGFLSNNCTKLKNKVLPVSYSCGQEAKDWSDRFVKVYDSQDEGLNGQYISADLGGQTLIASEKGCIRIPEGAKTGVLTVRDKRPAKQEGKIFSIDDLSFPASVKLDVLSAIVPQISCAERTFETNLPRIDVSVSGQALQQRERFKLSAVLKNPDGSSNALAPTLEDKNLRIDLGEIADGEYKIEIISTDELRKEESSVRVCSIRLDRTAPSAAVELPRSTLGAIGLARVKTDEKIKISSDDSTSQLFVSVLAQDKLSSECSESYIPAQLFETPKQGRWLLCYYSRDPAGNISKLQSVHFEIDEEPRRVLIEKLIDNAKLNSEKFRYEAAQESLGRAYTEWKKLALIDDQESLAVELKSGFFEVLQRQHLKQKKSIETYAGAFPLNGENAVIFREKDIAIVSIGKGDVLSGQADLGMMEGFAVSAAKKQFAVGDSDGRVRVIDEKLRTVLGYEDPDQSVFQKMAFSANGNRFATGSVFGSIIVWDLNGNKILLQKALEGRIQGLAFDASAEKIHVAVDGAVKSITIDATNAEKDFGTFDEGIENLINLDDKTILVHTTERLTTIDIASGAKKDVLASKKLAIEEIRLSPFGKYIAAKFEGGAVRLFQKDKFTELKSPALAAFKASTLAISDTEVGAVDADGFLRTFTLPKLESSASFRLAEGEAIQAVWFKGAGDLVSSTAKTLATWQLTNPLLKLVMVSEKIESEGVSDVALANDGKVQLAFRDGTIRTLSGDKSKTEKTIDGIGSGYTIFGVNTVLRFGHQTAMVFGKSDLSNSLKTFNIDDTANPESFLWNEIDNSFYLGSEGYLKLYDMKGAVSLSLQTVQPPYPVLKMAVAENGGPIIAGGERRGVISIWADRTASSIPKEFDAHELKITGLSFLNRSDAFVSTSEDGAIALWKVDGTPISKASAHPNETRQLIMHPSDGEILTIGDDRMLRVWNQDLKPLCSIILPTAARIFNLSSDSSHMVVVLENGGVLTIPSSVEQLHAALSAQP